MLPVEIMPIQDSVVLRARGSELLILPAHVQALKALNKPKDFSHYFRNEALVNRPARKLFEAWLRKDETLWPRLYKMIHKEMDLSAAESSASADKPAKTEEATATTPPVIMPEKATSKADKKPAEKASAKPATTAEEKPKKKEKTEKSVAKKKTVEKPAPKKKTAEKPEKAKTAAKATTAKDKKPAAKATSKKKG